MSQSGLARLCGVAESAIRKLLKSVRTSSCPKFLKPLQEEAWILRTSVNEFNNATIVKDLVCARILEWYAFESQRTTETARQAFRQFATLGIRTWIQGITGWSNSSPTSQTPSSPKLESFPDVTELLSQITELQHNLLVALKHRHAIHNIVEQPTVVDLSLNQIIHTAVHVQSTTLNHALTQLQSIHNTILNLDNFTSAIEETHSLWGKFQQVSNLVAQLSNENEQLQALKSDYQQIKRELTQLHLANQDLAQENSELRERHQAQTQRLRILCQRRQFNRTVLVESNQKIELVLEKRIQELTDLLMSQQKRQGGKRALKTCKLRANILARYELGESLQAIAEELEHPYQTVKSYVKLARQAIRAISR